MQVQHNIFCQKVNENNFKPIVNLEFTFKTNSKTCVSYVSCKIGGNYIIKRYDAGSVLNWCIPYSGYLRRVAKHPSKPFFLLGERKAH